MSPDPVLGTSSGLAHAVSRRTFLRRMALGAAAAAGSRWAVGAGTGVAGFALTQQGASAAAVPFSQPLTFPPVLTDAHITLTAAEADVAVLPGAPTRMWTYNGTFPGPTIRRPSGERTTLTVQHRLPADTGTLSLHHHGAHADPENDGTPHSTPVQPGGQREYVYDFVEDGEPERAATQWYHDHTHFLTSRNTWKGMVGLFIVDDAVDAALPLPKGEHDLALVITDRSFDAANQLTAPYRIYSDESEVGTPPVGGGQAPGDDIVGAITLINGVPQPYVEVEPRRYRVRILNAAHFQPYNLSLSDDTPLTQIATEGGLMPAPVDRSRVLIGPAERVELVLDFTGMSGRDVRLRSTGDHVNGSGAPFLTRAPGKDLLEFRVRGTAVDESSVPATLRPLPEWTADVTDVADRVWAFGVGVDPQGRGAWVVNGQAFDHHRVDARPEVGTTETWAFVNLTPNTSHYIHIHDVDWLLVSRNGEAPTPESGEAALKETFRLDPGEVLLVAAKFSDHLGKYMIHCHMLEHEDHGMMTTWEVVPPGQGDRVAGGLAGALGRDVPDADTRAHVEAVIAGACAGKPLDTSTLSRLQLDAIAKCKVAGGHRVSASAAHLGH